MSDQFDKRTLKIVDASTNPPFADVARRWVFEQWGRGRHSEIDHAVWFQKTVIEPSNGVTPVCLVAAHQGRPIATASTLDDDGLPAPYNKASGLTPWIAMVTTAEAFRGRGVASLLVGRCVEILATNGAPAVYLLTPDKQRLYERLAFESIGRSTTEYGESVTVMRRSF